MLRLLDVRTGSYAEVRPARAGLLRVCVRVPGASGGPDITGLRVLLIADLLARAAELGDLQVLTVLAFSGQPSGQVADLERAAGALGIHPPAARTSSADVRALLGGPIDVHLFGADADVDGSQDGLAARVGTAHMFRAGTHGEEAAGDILAGSGQDPLAIRLALMSNPYHQPASLTEGALADAGETLAHWRRAVAEWAESPSKPIPVRIAEAAQAAFADLDTRSALALLRGLMPDASVPAGAKFETFVYADRILGLDLPCEIGRPRRGVAGG